MCRAAGDLPSADPSIPLLSFFPTIDSLYSGMRRVSVGTVTYDYPPYKDELAAMRLA